MVKSKKQKYRRRKTVKRRNTYKRRNTFKQKPKRLKKAGMQKEVNFLNKNIEFSEKKLSIIKRYLDANREDSYKEMPSRDVIEQLEGKDIFQGLLPHGEEYYDLLEKEYAEEKIYLKLLKQDLEQVLKK